MTPPSWRQAPIGAPLPETPSPIRLGLGANWRQFTLLVVVNAFVGAMVGLERTVVPLIAQADFGLVSKTVVLSFLVSFGIVKALANLFGGQLADRIGRKPLLVAGWLAGLPVPLLIIWAPSWGWIVFANVLLGLNQGLCWSTTVIMKIDLVGPARRGLAMGLNECAGYVAVSLSALLTGYLAAARGLTLDRIGVVTATYPLVWGMGQLATGALSDRWGRKWMIASGMWVQAVGITAFVVGRSFASWMAGATLLEIGTALVYPTLLAAVSDVAHPDWRASAVGVYRLWRDSGYAIGAIAAGLLADAFTMPFAIAAIAVLTFVSGVVVAGVMYETLPHGLSARVS